jgi:hypothetical protein
MNAKMGLQHRLLFARGDEHTMSITQIIINSLIRASVLCLSRGRQGEQL